MKYAAEMGSGAMIHIPSCIKVGSGTQKLMGGFRDTLIHRQHEDRILLPTKTRLFITWFSETSTVCFSEMLYPTDLSDSDAQCFMLFRGN
jgi:hypothetical protein